MNRYLIHRLKKRKQDLAMTLAHIRQEQSEVEMNTEWKDLFAQRRRHTLLADLSAWYDGKLKQIDNVLERITQPDKSAWGTGNRIRCAPTVTAAKNRSKRIWLGTSEPAGAAPCGLFSTRL